jgi:hypothetical protein
MREFTSGDAAEQPQDVPDITDGDLALFTFGMDGAEFTCALRIDADALIEWSEFAAAVMEGDLDSESPEGVGLTSKLLRLAMPNGEYRRFRSHLRAHHTKPDVLMQVLQYINEEMEAAVARRTNRPTGKPSTSSGGGTAQGGRVARVISLQAGDVTTVPMPEPQDHKPKAAKPKAAVRGAGRRRTATAGTAS